jgi:hypothetical protein
MVSELLHIAWNRWKIIGNVFGDFQARFFVVLFYFTIFAPFALGARLFSDPLRLRSSKNGWLDRPPVEKTLDAARRQF